MAHVTAEDVIAIIPSCSLTADQVDPFINSAHQFLDNVYATDTTLSYETRYEIERWFVAHLLVSTGYQESRAVKREKLGDAEVEYSVSDIKGQGVSSTTYGKMALMCDTTGLLAKAEKMKASIYAIRSFDE
jgi:hypothetical protein